MVKDTEALKRDEYVLKLGFITDPLPDLEKLAIELKFCKRSIQNFALVFQGNGEDEKSCILSYLAHVTL